MMPPARSSSPAWIAAPTLSSAIARAASEVDASQIGAAADPGAYDPGG